MRIVNSVVRFCTTDVPQRWNVLPTLHKRIVLAAGGAFLMLCALVVCSLSNRKVISKPADKPAEIKALVDKMRGGDNEAANQIRLMREADPALVIPDYDEAHKAYRAIAKARKKGEAPA